MATKRTVDPPEGRTNAGAAQEGTPTPPKRVRVPLRSIGDVENELARLYRSAKAGQIATADASRLAYMLTALGRLKADADLERRIRELEERHDEDRRAGL